MWQDVGCTTAPGTVRDRSDGRWNMCGPYWFEVDEDGVEWLCYKMLWAGRTLVTNKINWDKAARAAQVSPVVGGWGLRLTSPD